MIIVSTPPKIYARVRFSIPNIMGEMKIYAEQIYVIATAGNKAITEGFLFFAR